MNQLDENYLYHNWNCIPRICIGDIIHDLSSTTYRYMEKRKELEETKISHDLLKFLSIKL